MDSGTLGSIFWKGIRLLTFFRSRTVLFISCFLVNFYTLNFCVSLISWWFCVQVILMVLWRSSIIATWHWSWTSHWFSFFSISASTWSPPGEIRPLDLTTSQLFAVLFAVFLKVEFLLCQNCSPLHLEEFTCDVAYDDTLGRAFSNYDWHIWIRIVRCLQTRNIAVQSACSTTHLKFLIVLTPILATDKLSSGRLLGLKFGI